MYNINNFNGVHVYTDTKSGEHFATVGHNVINLMGTGLSGCFKSFSLFKREYSKYFNNIVEVREGDESDIVKVYWSDTVVESTLKHTNKYGEGFIPTTNILFDGRYLVVECLACTPEDTPYTEVIEISDDFLEIEWYDSIESGYGVYLLNDIYD